MTSQQSPDSPPEPASTPAVGVFDKVWWGLHSYMLPLAVLLIILLCVGLTFVSKPWFERRPDSSIKIPVADTSPTQIPFEIFASTQQSDTLYFAQRLGSDTSEVFRLDMTLPEATPVNLTRSHNYDEWWAVPSPIDERLAFFAVTLNGERSLRVLEPDGHVLDLTYQSGESQLGTVFQVHLQVPPQWAPDSEWLAFLGEQRDGKGKAVELFVARTDKPLVRRLTRNGNVVTTVHWLDDRTLIYTEARGDGLLALYQVSLAYDPATPVLLATLQSSD